MSALGEARYTNPLTITMRADEKALLVATAAENRMNVTELLRECVRACLGEVLDNGSVAAVTAAVLRPPSRPAVRQALRVERERAAVLLAAKRERQRTSSTGDEAARG